MDSVLIQRLKSIGRRIPGARAVWQHLKRFRRQGTLFSSQVSPAQVRAAVEAAAHRELLEFLNSPTRLEFARSATPQVSIVMVLFNRAELTLRSLRSLVGIRALSTQLIVVDNGSSDRTAELFEKVDGVLYLRQSENLHFLRGTNLGATHATGETILLLNNDTEVLPGAIEAAYETLSSSPVSGPGRIGAVGGKLILPDGTLQEAGSLIWRDGTCLGYGRGDDPSRAPYQFRRPVDFCSGAFLLTPTKLWRELAGLDERYAPAYYEEVDYCLRLAEQGYQVVYEPRSVVRHFEFASSKRPAAALELQTKNRMVLLARHQKLLNTRPLPGPQSVLTLRTAADQKRTVLWIDERIPHNDYGAGYPRAQQIVRALHELKMRITVLPALHVDHDEGWERVYQSVPREVEVLALPGYGPEYLEQILSDRRGGFDRVVVSRPDTMRAIRKILQRRPELLDLGRVVYDAEAIFAFRAKREAVLQGKPLSEMAFAELLREELALTEGVGAITTVSEGEATIFRAYQRARTYVVSHAVTPVEPAALSERSGVLFVGAVYGDGGPNFDSLRWYVEEVSPHLHSTLPLTVVGRNESAILRRYPTALKLLGAVPDLTPLYNGARVFVAPTRFSAGIPLKVVDAAAAGVPCVITEHLAEQLGVTVADGFQIASEGALFASHINRLLTDDAAWQESSKNQLAYISEHFSRKRMKVALLEALG